MFVAGQKVTDGYFTYTVLCQTADGYVTATLCGHRFRLVASELVGVG